VTPATFQIPDRMVAHVNLDEARRFLSTGRESAATALQPARRLFDDSVARRLAVEIETCFSDAQTLFDSALSEREKFARDQTTKPEVIFQQRQALQADYSERSGAIVKRIADLSTKLEAALAEEAMPAPSSDSAVALVRQELELALATAPDGRAAFQVLDDYAARGGDFAAVAASDWARLSMQGKEGGDIGYDRVLATAARSSLNSPDPARQRAATALEALTDAQGRNQLVVGNVYLNSALESAGEMLEVPVEA
jgi:hypothetical protein